MQSQDASTAFLFKLWPWIEANKNRLIGGATVAVVAIFIIWFVVSQRNQREIEAGQALAQLSITAGEQTADAYLKIANEYPTTLSGRRAWLQGAAALFAADRFADAQGQFQSYLEAHPDGDLSASAALGVAASLEALGKLDLAVGAYQRVVNGFSDVVTANVAKFALARIDERQGKFTDALDIYESIARSSPGSVSASEAGMRAVALRAKLASATSSAGNP